MKNKKVEDISIGKLIALCHILDDFEKFNNNLSSFILENGAKEYIDNQTMASCLREYRDDDVDISERFDQFWRSKHAHDKKIIQKFYEANKNIIDTINKYFTIDIWVRYNYDHKGNLMNDSDLVSYYKYLINNKDNLSNIISLLNAMQKLGISFVALDESLEFTNIEYEIDSSFKNNKSIEYLDNIQIVPNFQSSNIKYKTTNSNYKIVLFPIKKKSEEEISPYDVKIFVNSLVFNSNTLPKSISKADTFDKIVNLWKSNTDCVAATNHADLNTKLENLIPQIDSINDLISKLGNAENKPQALEIIYRMRADLDQLRTIDFDNNNRKK